MQGGSQLLRRLGAEAGGAKTFRETREIGVAQGRADGAALKLLLLVAADIAVSVVVEHDVDYIQPVFHRGRQFRRLVHEAAVPPQGNHLFAGIGDLDSQGRRVAVPQVALVAAGDEMPRAVHRKPVPRGVAHLGDFVNEEAVFRQLLPDDAQDLHLRPHLGGEFREDGGFHLGQLLLARFP